MFPSCSDATTEGFVQCRRIVEQSLELYTCSAASADSEMPPAQRNATLPTTYNELATLMSVTGEPPIRACLFLSAKTSMNYVFQLATRHRSPLVRSKDAPFNFCHIRKFGEEFCAPR